MEALLRYKHHLHGMIYPPLVIKLAEEAEILPALEESVLVSAIEEKDKIVERFGENVRVSVNTTGTTVVTQRFLQFCKRLKDSGKLSGIDLCIEITEQATLSFSEQSLSVLKSLREMGITLAIDDFSMGKTSLNYLKDNLLTRSNWTGRW